MAIHSRTRAAAAIRAALLTFVAMPFFGLALYLAVPQVHEIWLAQQSSKWPSVLGVVAVSHAVPGPRLRGTIAQVEYAYLAEGRVYLGKRVQFGNVNGSAEWAQSVAARFPVGQVRVFYSPEAPHEAVLIPGSVRSVSYFTAALALAFGLPGIYLLVKVRAQFKNVL